MATLPEYPQMKPLEITDRPAIEACTHSLPCSSDHNFTSLWMWDTTGQTRVSRIGMNLVIQLADYATHEPHLTLIGSDDITSAAEHILTTGVDRLRLVPEFVVEHLPPHRFLVEADRDQFDYIYDVAALAALDGREFRKQRQGANRCAHQLGSRLRTVAALTEPPAVLLELFDRWAFTRGKCSADTQDERAAVERLIESWGELTVSAFALYNECDLIGAQVFELLPDCALSHYMKADASYPGIFSLLDRTSHQHLVTQGIRFINAEQDLGIEGLRTRKLQDRPVEFVKKHRVSLGATS